VYPQPFFTGQYSQDFILGNDQPSLRDLNSCALHSPALTCWATFSRPYGTVACQPLDSVFVLIVIWQPAFVRSGSSSIFSTSY
jgi:hypothetical protein